MKEKKKKLKMIHLNVQADTLQDCFYNFDQSLDTQFN